MYEIEYLVTSQEENMKSNCKSAVSVKRKRVNGDERGIAETTAESHAGSSGLSPRRSTRTKR